MRSAIALGRRREEIDASKWCTTSCSSLTDSITIALWRNTTSLLPHCYTATQGDSWRNIHAPQANLNSLFSPLSWAPKGKSLAEVPRTCLLVHLLWDCLSAFAPFCLTGEKNLHASLNRSVQLSHRVERVSSCREEPQISSGVIMTMQEFNTKLT